MFFDLQQTDKPADRTTHRSLYEPSGFSNERGDYEGHVAKSSVYTQASLHPWIAGGLLAACAALVWASRTSKTSSLNAAALKVTAERARDAAKRSNVV
jgi:hypothetical protein